MVRVFDNLFQQVPKRPAGTARPVFEPRGSSGAPRAVGIGGAGAWTRWKALEGARLSPIQSALGRCPPAPRRAMALSLDLWTRSSSWDADLLRSAIEETGLSVTSL